jgi:hypothetical protein
MEVIISLSNLLTVRLIVKRLGREIITSIRLAHSQKIEEGNNNLHQVSSLSKDWRGK